MSKEEEFVLVDVDVMLGDADSSITGFAVLLKSDWEEEVKEFEEYLEKKKVEYIELESEHFGSYQMNLESYSVKPCTKAERATFKKFFGKGLTYGDFRSPLEFLECLGDEEESDEDEE